MAQLDVERELLSLLDALSSRLTSEDVTLTRTFLEHSERGLAFEQVCIALKERGAKTTHDEYERLKAIGQQMGMADHYWLSLRIGTAE